MEPDEILRGIINMQADIRDLKKVNEEQDAQIKKHEDRLKKYDTMATKLWGFGLGVIAVGVLLSSGIDAIRNKLLGVLVP